MAEFVVKGQTVSIGWLIALLVLIAVFVLWIVGKGSTIELGLIGALALAYLIG